MRYGLLSAVVALLAVLVGLPTAVGGEGTHRNGFAANNDPFWVRGDANIHFDEKAHRITDEKARNATTSEYIKIEANPAPGSTSAEYVHYYYATPPAPVGKELTGKVWVKGFSGGAQLKARVVLPKEKDPKNPDVFLTTLVAGDTYSRVREWQQLSLPDMPGELGKLRAVLTARVGHPVDLTDAYVDQLVLNVYGGPGVSELWIDDLEVGPCLPKPQGVGDAPRQGKTTGNPAKKTPLVEFSNGDIVVDMNDGKGPQQFFMRAVRHSGVPLAVLEQARFNTIWFPDQVTDDVYEEALRAKFFLVPGLPLPAADWDASRPGQTDAAVLDKDAEVVAKHLRRFLSGDGVLMWDLGTGRTTDQVRRVAKVADVVKTFDPRRPRAVDLWDGFRAYSSYVDAVGAHRWPLFSSLELVHYKDWLTERRALTAPGKLSWTWIQTHLPEWYLATTTGNPNTDVFPDPVGPHPEQIRVLTYLALAAGYRGLGFWSDKFLSDACHGKDRLIEIALLNTELELLEPVLLNAQGTATWYNTSDANVKAAVIAGAKEMVILPVWLGGGTQYCPAQGVVNSLTLTVPIVPDGASAWRITPAGVDQIKDVKRVSGGTEVTITEFDMTAAIVFTTDLAARGKVVKWQDQTKNKLARTAAYYARAQAIVQFNKALEVHKKIVEAGGPDYPEAGELLWKSKEMVDRASEYTDNDQPEMAYREARRALRPLRLLMREDWQRATAKLDFPTASPYAMSFFSLPQHWQLAGQLQGSRPGGNSVAYGNFEMNDRAPAEGAAVASLPGWQSRRTVLDPVVTVAAVVNTDGEFVADLPAARKPFSKDRFTQPGRPVPTAADAIDAEPKPELGRHCLMLKIYPKTEKPTGEKVPAPKALERSFLAVDSAAAELPPGSWVRISFWAKNPGGVASTADGVMVYDSACGEPLGLRLYGQGRWKQYHFYRQVPASGKISVTFALTGIGLVYFDDLQIEPLLPALPGEKGITVSRPTTATPKPRPPAFDENKLPFPRDVEPKKPMSEALPPPKAGLPK